MRYFAMTKHLMVLLHITNNLAVFLANKEKCINQSHFFYIISFLIEKKTYLCLVILKETQSQIVK